jgi:hypothetical protein
MPDQAVEHIDPVASPPTVSHVFRVLKAYLPVIALTMLAIAVGYVIAAVAIYILAPSQRVTIVPFRLEFEGAERGEYPNGTKFSPTEIISTPILVDVYKKNHLERFVKFPDFAASVFVVESNAARDTLAREYQSRLSDPKLTPVDRDRIQREYELKLSSISKDQYSINYGAVGETSQIPAVITAKVLKDILLEWSDFAANERHVLKYRVAVMSPDFVSATLAESDNSIIANQVLRTKILRVIANIDQIRTLPAAELVRTKDNLALIDIRTRLDDIVRFRLEPLVLRIASAGFDDRGSTLRFLRTQLAYDERQLATQQRIAEASQRTLAMYMNTPTSGESLIVRGQDARAETSPTDGETVMPQLSDSFLERLIQLTSSATDSDYRKRLTEQFREGTLAIGPLTQAVAYDQSVIDLLQSGSQERDSITKEIAQQQITATREEVRQLVTKVHELYNDISRNLNPSTELMTVATPTTRVDRTMSLKRLALFGVLVLLVALPITIFLCFLHHRIRREEEEEEFVTATRDAIETPA